ncbi:MAG TPA: DUF6282 family protein [Iamia sp.]|nr:DUF6282 family protein [Iamia sp.]
MTALDAVETDDVPPRITGVVDFHVHTAPSLVERHHHDGEVLPLAAAAGIDTVVLKAHEGSTAERAALLGGGAVGSVVLNSPVGGANPDAVEVAARLGARVVWMPTISSVAHQAASRSAELEAHRGVSLRTVPVTDDGALLDEWLEVFDVVARHDLVLSSGHLTADETVVAFAAARARGVTRLVVTHPLLPFLGWRPDHCDSLRDLGAHLEVGVLADLLAGPPEDLVATTQLAATYPPELLVFGSDLGHRSYPDIEPGVNGWVRRACPVLGERHLEALMTTTGRELLAP